MPFTPDDPFPKTQGHTIRSKDWNDSVYEIQRLDADKLKNSTDTFRGTLSVTESVSISKGLGVGAAAPGGGLHIVHQNQNANGGAIILGPTNAANLRLGYDAEYSWIQAHGAKPLAINPIGNNVGIGTPAPEMKLDVNGAIRAFNGTVRGGTSKENYTEVGHGGTHGYINRVGVGQLDFRFAGANQVSIEETGRLVVHGGKLKVGNFGGGYPEWIDWANTPGFFTGNGSDNAFFGMRNRAGAEGGGNEFDTVIYWGDDTTDHLIFESQDLGEVLRVTGGGRIGFGLADPSRKFHVHADDWNQGGAEIHASGKTAGISFADRDNGGKFDDSVAGNRWIWYSTGRVARLWTSQRGNILSIDTDGQLGQQGWQGVSFQNKWVNYSNSYNPCGYFKDSMGIVHLRGLVKDGPIGSVIFNLPAGYRPAYRQLFIARQSTNDVNGHGRIDILTNGNVEYHAGHANSWVSLDGLTFRAEA